MDEPLAQVTPCFSVKTLLLRSKLRFIVDHDFAVDLALYLPAGTFSPYSLGFDRRPSRQEVARLCQQKHGILATADSAYVPLLSLSHKTSWGVLLLPDNESAQLNVVRRLFAGNLAFRPSVERMAMVDYASRNRLLVDMRHDEPVVSIFSDCRWLS
jgi:hypothetical protein